MKLLSNGSHKWDLSDASGKGFLTKGMYLSPARSGGHGNVCPFSTPGCREACLVSSGRMDAYVSLRQARTEFFFTRRRDFMYQLVDEIQYALNTATRKGLRLAVRLNGTSDLAWEALKIPGKNATIVEVFSDVQFYDYTKNPQRMARFLQDPAWPRNYHLTFSLSEENEENAKWVLQKGGNIAVVFAPSASLLEFFTAWGDAAYWQDGDAHDLTFLHPPGSVLALKPKGRARRDKSGFVVR